MFRFFVDGTISDICQAEIDLFQPHVVASASKGGGDCFERHPDFQRVVRINIEPFWHLHLSSVQNPGWLFDIEDYTTQLYGDLFINHYKDPVLKQAVYWKVRGFF